MAKKRGTKGSDVVVVVGKGTAVAGARAGGGGGSAISAADGRSKAGVKKVAGKRAAAGAKAGGKSGGKGAVRSKPTLAEKADKHVLYEQAVQNVESEIDFVDATFERIRGRKASRLREDFCGTANTSCEWVRRRKSNTAVGIDLDPEPLGWGREHHVAGLTPNERSRVTLLEDNVLTAKENNFDVVLAMNFSYWCFITRAQMLEYFKKVHAALGEEGVFFLDFYGGEDTFKELEEEREVGRFTYIWEQVKFNPINGKMHCRISFKMRDGSMIRPAFEYHWRVWTMPEIREVLADAGFKRTRVFWEGVEDEANDEGFFEGNGEFVETEDGDADQSYICYIAAEK